MFALPKVENKRMIAVHGWSGIVLGLILYVVILTGMLAVFAEEIGDWSSGKVDHSSALSNPVDSIVTDLAAQTSDEYKDEVGLSTTSAGNLSVFFHGHFTEDGGSITERGVRYEVDGEGEIVKQIEGSPQEVFGEDATRALEDLFVDLHIRLHIPSPWGEIVTGILGLAMMVAAVTGILIHRHLFRDIFTIRRKTNEIVAERDRHSVAGTWSLPFTFILAFTGSFFSFTIAFGLPAMAMVAFQGDQEAMIEAVVGAPPEASDTKATGANLDSILQASREVAGSEPLFMNIIHYGSDVAQVNVGHAVEDGDFFRRTFGFDGATGEFTGEKPLVGSEPSAGANLVGIIGALHFGNFAGILSRAIWFGLGFASCYVTLTGIRMWLRRRREEQTQLRWLEKLTTTIAWGTPLSIAVGGVAFFLTLPLGLTVEWTMYGFLIGAGVILAFVPLLTEQRLADVLRAALALCLIGLPALRLAFGGPGWPDAFAAGDAMLIAIDIAVVVSALVIAYPLYGSRRFSIPHNKAVVAGPAE
ncbi:MAG: PepSY-associated TM helix domain-containing protein [Pseudomonadota bacterium]